MSALPVPASIFGSGSGLATSSGSSMSRSVTKAVGKELDWLSARTEVAIARDDSRARLTNGAMHNVGTLVMTGQSLMHVAPEGAAHYETLLSAYAVGAAQAVARFQ